MNITSGNKTELKLALAMYGPVTVLINTRPKTFKFYSSGVYFDQNCGAYNRLHLSHQLEYLEHSAPTSI